MRPMRAMQANAPQRSESPSVTRGIEVAEPCCAICGSKAVVFDEVIAEPAIELGECLHCEHRWTLAGPRAGGWPASGTAFDDAASDADINDSWCSRVSNAA